MVTKRMNLAAKSIQNINNSIKNSMSQNRYGDQYALFASAIIEKYAKTLNYHFDYTALVFLETMAGREKRQQISKNVINLTWKLLSFLFREGDKRNIMLYQNPWIIEQITRQIEDNLQKIKKEKSTEYHNLERCYKVYQREIKKEGLSEKTRQEKIEKVRNYVEKQISFMYSTPKRKEEKVHAITPFTMNYGFFYNLNHAISDNKIMNNRQIWKKSVEQQLEQYYLDISMNTFAKEQQTELKQEIFLDILQYYDGNAIQTYLRNTNEKVYTQFWDYVQSIINVTNAMEQVKEKKILKKKTGSDYKIVNEFVMGEKIEEGIGEYKIDRQKKLAEDIEEYKHIHRKIMDILEQTQEITRNIIIEKSREYEERFYAYIHDEKNKSSNNESKVLKEYKQEFPAFHYEEKDPEVFSDNEIALLLKEQEMVDKKVEYSLKLQKEIIYLKEKLSLLAMKAVVERCLMEDTGILHREKIENIAETLEKVDFYSKRKEEHRAPIQEIQSVTEKHSEIGIENINIVFQEGILPERKLLYLAMEKGIDEILIEEDNFNIQKQILELKRKIIQEEDYGKRILGDWRFLMKKSRSTEIVKAIEMLEQEEKTSLEERVRKIIQTFHHMQDELYHLYQQSPISSIETKNDLKTVYEKNKNLWKEWSTYFSKEEMIQMQERRIEQQEKRMEQNSWSNVIKLQNTNTEVQNALINNTNIQVKDIIEILHNGRGPEKEFLLLALQKIFSKENKILTKKTDFVEILQVIEEIKKLSKETKVEKYKKSFIESKTIEKFIYALNHLTAEEQKEIESRISIYRKQFYHYLVRQKKKETEELQDEKIFKSITVITMESIKTVFQEGILPERKRLYLAIEEGIDEILTKEKKENSYIQRQILELKNKITRKEDYEKRILGDWRFLMKKSRSLEIVMAIEELDQEEKMRLEERVREIIQKFYQMQDEIYHLYQQSQMSSLEIQKDLKTVYGENENLWKEWSTYFSKEEMIQMQERRIEQQEKRTEQNSWNNVIKLQNANTEVQNALINNTNIQVKDIIEILHNGRSPEKEFLLLALQKIFSKENKILTKKTDFDEILQAINEMDKLSEEAKIEDYKGFFMESESLEKLVYALNHLTAEEQKEIESQISIYRNQFYHYLARHKEKETEEIEELQDEKIFKSIKAITIESIKTVFHEGILSERKLLYLSIEKGIDEILTEKDNSNIQKQILELKNKIIQEEDYRKRTIGDWRFLMKKSRSTEIVKAIEKLDQEEKIKLEEGVREIIQKFYQMQDEIYHLYEQSQETQKNLKTVYEKNKNLWKEWSAYFSKEEIIQIQEKRMEQNSWRNEINMQNGQYREKWFSYLEKEEREELRSKEIYFLKAGYNENIKSLEEMVSVGTLAERKFIFLSMQAVIEEEIIETGIDPDRWMERGQLVMLKRELISEQIKEQIMKKDWNFLQESTQKNKIIKVFQAFHEEAKEKFMRNIRQGVLILHFSENLEEKRINNVSEDIIQYVKKKEKDKLYDSIKLFYKDIINEKSDYLLEERNWQNVSKEENTFIEFKNNDRKNVKIIDKKLKIFEEYVNILHINREYKEKNYNFVKNLSRKKNNYWKDVFQNNVYFTQNNIHFMEPPVSSLGREKESIMPESLQYQGENIHFILEHIRKETDLHKNNQNISLDEQKREIRELKNNILEYQMELKDKEERIETVEKQLKNQEENIQFLKSTQDNISREVNSSAEAKKMMERLKEELQLEQMRNGIL